MGESLRRLAVFGKGGIGKSTLASNLSTLLAAQGQRVLHVGCDPKHDSTAPLLGGEIILPVADRPKPEGSWSIADVITRSPTGVDCVEAGGPQAGVGCGGRAISRMAEIFKEASVLDASRYDLALFDVLGDVVCGGFAAPLRRDMGEVVLIVASEEVMALYAANNIARAVVHYAANGVSLMGIALNVRDHGADLGPAERFAARIGTRIVATIPRDPLVREAEYRGTTVAHMAPNAPITGHYRALAAQILALDPATLPLPTPLSDEEFRAAVRARFEDTSAADKQAGAGQDDEYRAELAAGMRAVAAGLVSAEEALRRLREHYPQAAARLGRGDLTQ